jgi:hypothetical protein
MSQSSLSLTNLADEFEDGFELFQALSGGDGEHQDESMAWRRKQNEELSSDNICFIMLYFNEFTNNIS